MGGGSGDSGDSGDALPSPQRAGLRDGRQGAAEEWEGLRGSAGMINDESGV